MGNFDDISLLVMSEWVLAQVIAYHDTVHNITISHLCDRQLANYEPVCVVQGTRVHTQCTVGRTVKRWQK